MNYYGYINTVPFLSYITSVFTGINITVFFECAWFSCILCASLHPKLSANCLKWWFSKCGLLGVPEALSGTNEAKAPFITMLRQHGPFSVCWHLQRRNASTDVESCRRLGVNEATATTGTVAGAPLSTSHLQGKKPVRLRMFSMKQ